ncbi:MAG: glycosyltransferase [Gemmatimonadetes bacterium]|nr:glycosyltransferase [Gemmatimonadota bacterium]
MSQDVARKPQQRRPEDTRLQVVFFLDNLDIGGTELAALRIARYMDPDRVRIRVVALRSGGPLRDEFQRLGIDVFELPVRGLARLGTVRAAFRLLAHLRKWTVHILHTFDPYTNILGVPVGRVAGVGLVVASHRWWDGVHPRRLEETNRRVVRFAHRLVANSERVGQLAVRKGLPPRRLAIVPNFVEPELQEDPTGEWIAERRAHLGIPREVPVIGVVASLRRLKGHRTVLSACAERSELESAHVLFVGDGPERLNLEQQAKESGLGGRVHFAGRLPNLPNLHHLFDVSVLCSLTEAFPNSLLEAMAAGKPVVASDVGGIPDAIEDGVVGYLVPPGDEQALADRLVTLLADPLLRATMGEAGRRRIRDRFSKESAMRSLLAVYRGDAASGDLLSDTPIERGWRDEADQKEAVKPGEDRPPAGLVTGSADRAGKAHERGAADG